jgi:hypothetical protein
MRQVPMAMDSLAIMAAAITGRRIIPLIQARTEAVMMAVHPVTEVTVAAVTEVEATSATCQRN